MKYPNLVNLQNAHGLSDNDMGKIIGHSGKCYRNRLNKGVFYASDMIALCKYSRASADFIFAGGEAV